MREGVAKASQRPLARLLPGGDLLSQGTAPRVPSALASFTSVFGMGTGGSSPLMPPDKPLSVGQPEHSIASTKSYQGFYIQALGLLVPVR